MDAVAEPEFERGDEGKGSFNNYKYDLLPNNRRVRVRLAGSNPHQQAIKDIVDSGETRLETAISRRTTEQERIDSPIEVRLFTGSRVSPLVGIVPRGLESIVDEALSRLDKLGRKQRIPVEIVRKGGKYRVELLMGETR